MMRDSTWWNPFTAFAVGIVIMTAAVVLFFRDPGGLLVPAPPGVHLPAARAPALRREEIIPVQVAVPLQVYKPAAKKKLKLPEPVVADDAQHVVASSRTPNDERRHTVTTVLDTGTGTFATYDRAEPLPWIAVNTKSEIGVFYGFKTGGERVIRLQGQQELLQIKSIHLGAIASADLANGNVDTFVGVGAWARW